MQLSAPLVRSCPSSTAHSFLWLGSLLTVVLISGTVQGDFRAAMGISESPSDALTDVDASSPDIACDGGDQLAVVFQRGDELVYASSTHRFDNFDLTFGSTTEAGPLKVASSSVGDFLSLYVEGGECNLKNDPEFLVFSSTLSNDGIDCYHVDCDGALESPGEVAFVWQEGTGDDAEVYLENTTVSGELLASGETPAVHVSESDNYTHVVYRDGDDLHYQQWAYGDSLLSFDATVASPSGPETGISIAVHESATTYSVYVVFRNDGTLYYSLLEDALTGFEGEVEIGTASGDADLAVKSTGDLVLAYTDDGVVMIVDDFLGADETEYELTESGSGAESVSIAIDIRDAIHVAYAQNGTIYYTNDVPNDDAPHADFSASITTGSVPLTVEFENLSTGVVWYADWEFGDGLDSEEFGPVSTTYGAVDNFTVSLTVTGPAGEDTLTLGDFISTEEAAYWMRLPSVAVEPGEKSVTQFIVGGTSADCSGYSIALAFDSDQTEVIDLTVDDTDSGELGPEFESTIIENDGLDSFAILGVVYESLPPFDGTVLAEGSDLTLAKLEYDVPEAADHGLDLALRLENGVSDPPVNNGYTVDLGAGSETRLAYLYNPGIRTLALLDFIRGDSDLTGSLTLVDPLMGLTYAFGISGPPECLDAADSNDDGTVNILDGLFTLTFVFLSGPEPPAPYPEAGTDPTDDDLGDCLH